MLVGELAGDESLSLCWLWERFFEICMDQMTMVEDWEWRDRGGVRFEMYRSIR